MASGNTPSASERDALEQPRSELRALWNKARFAEARAAIDQALGRFGPLAGLEVMRARHELRELEAQEAVTAEKRAAELARLRAVVSHASQPDDVPADVLVEAAVAAYELEDSALAQRLLGRLPHGAAEKLDPNLLGPLCFVMGRLMMKHGRRRDAEELFRAAIDADPSLPNGYAGLAAALAERGNLVGASDALERGLRGVPGDPELTQLVEDLAQVPAHVRDALRSRAAPEVPGEHDRCWCGSGRRRADCHGAAAD